MIDEHRLVWTEARGLAPFEEALAFGSGYLRERFSDGAGCLEVRHGRSSGSRFRLVTFVRTVRRLMVDPPDTPITA